MTSPTPGTSHKPTRRWLALVLAGLLVAPPARASNFTAWLENNGWIDAVTLNELLIQAAKVACLWGQLAACRPGPCETCPTGGAQGYCAEVRCSIGPDGQQWLDDSSGPTCGRSDVFGPRACDVQCVEVGCKWPPRGATGSLTLGYDALPPDQIPASVAEIVPPPGGVLFDDQPILVRFDESMDALGVTLGGLLGAQANSDYVFSRQLAFNDTLTVAPAARWSSGSRTLNVRLLDTAGNPTELSASWFVLPAGTSLTPDFQDCRADLGQPCGARWFTPYAALFTASGGVPPYTWSAGAGALPHEASFAADGLFVSHSARPGCGPVEGALCLAVPPTCILFQHCLDPVEFPVCVADRFGTRTCHGVRWEFGL